MKTSRSAVLGGVALALVSMVGCEGSVDRTEPFQVGTVSARLTRAESCEDLLQRIQADAETKVRLNAREARDETAMMRGGILMLDDGAPMANTGVGADAGSDGAAVAGPENYSETNTQVEGVDEADIVKTDGEHIYLLHGTQLFVLDSWPANATSISAQVEIEGYPVEMFVNEGRALVYSHADDPMPGEATLNTPDCLGCEWDYCGEYWGGNFLKLTVIDVSSSEPSVLHESYSEGSYVSARMHGSLARGVIQGGFKGPSLYPYVEYWDSRGIQRSQTQIDLDIARWERDVLAAIEDTELEDWLPRSYVKKGETVSAAELDCSAFYVPDASAAAFGITRVAALDLAADTPTVSAVSIVGQAHEIYANHDVLMLAQNDYSWGWRDVGGSQTAVHLFEIANANLKYVASGHAPGTIHDQFSLDERDGIVRLSTTQELTTLNNDWQTRNFVVTMKPNAKGALKIHGTTEALAPGETVYSTRFIGDIAYVVTFRQMDPLFAIDLSDAAHPTRLGELHIPGFSDYMHPLGEDHLLTIGRDIDPNSQQDRGLLLQIFDVSDPSNPRQAFTHSYDQDGWSEANHEHKAFNYYAPLNLLAFPYTNYSGGGTSSLELFRVSTETGFEPLGAIDHSVFANSDCYNELDEYWMCNYSPDVRRGLFIEDFVYSISYGGVLVHSLDDLTTPVASVDLPEPDASSPYYYW